MKFNPIELLKQVREQSSNLKDFKFDKKMDKEKRTQSANSIIRNHIENSPLVALSNSRSLLEREFN